MKITLIAPLLIICQISFAQTQEQKDALVNEICNTINHTANLSDTDRLRNAFSTHLTSFAKKYPEVNQKELMQFLFYRLQRNCDEGKKLINRLMPQKGDWTHVNEKPVRLLDDTACKNFLLHGKYSYLEVNGDTVHLEIKNGYWIDHFKDGSYSKLELKWLNDCEFEIVFVESNNEIRKNYSSPGDKYRYQIIDRKENYYFMSVEIVGKNNFSTFKIYCQ